MAKLELTIFIYMMNPIGESLIDFKEYRDHCLKEDIQDSKLFLKARYFFLKYNTFAWICCLIIHILINRKSLISDIAMSKATN